MVSDESHLDRKINTDRPADTHPVLLPFLHWLLDNGGMEEAAQLLWTPNQFSPYPKSTQDVWKLFDRASTGLIMGGASMSKSFGMGVRLFLEWVRDPAWTTVRVIGPSEDHLQTNLFSHLVGLHDQASLPMPGEVGNLYIGVNRRNLVSSIKGVVIPIGKVKKAGRLQGTKRKPRTTPHAQFGELSRLFIFMDEAENIPGGVWSDIDNVLSNTDESGNDGLKIFMAYNPQNQFAEVGVRAEPVFGWSGFDVDVHYEWKSKRGWDVLRLDGERSENVVQKRLVYPGLQTAAGLAKIAQNAGGVNSPGYFSMGRGAYPPQGVEMTILPQAMVARARGEFIWMDPPSPIGAVDGALEGRATASFSLGKLGMATGIKYPPSVTDPQGKTVMFRSNDAANGRVNIVVPKWALQVDNIFALPKGDTVAMKERIIDISRRAGIKGELLCLDRTGNFAGAHDLIKNEWSPAVIGVNYSSSPTTGRIMQEDEQVCKDAFDRIDSELWFALRAWMEFGHFIFHPQVELNLILPQLTQRRYRTVGGKRKVESKKDYKARGFESPDEADSVTLLVHAARLGGGVTPSMKGGPGDMGPDSDEWWEGEGGMYAGGSRIDVSNRVESLDG